MFGMSKILVNNKEMVITIDQLKPDFFSTSETSEEQTSSSVAIPSQNSDLSRINSSSAYLKKTNDSTPYVATRFRRPVRVNQRCYVSIALKGQSCGDNFTC